MSFDGLDSDAKLPVQDAGSSFRRKVLRVETRFYHTVYTDRHRKYVLGERPDHLAKPQLKRSRLRSRAANTAARNVISVAREYDAYLARAGVYGYRQVAEHFNVSKVMVSYYLSLLTRLPESFLSWLEACQEELPLTFFSLKRLRPVTMLDEADRRAALLALAQTLVKEMEGQPSDSVPELLLLLGAQSVDGPRPREFRAFQLD